MLLLTLIMLMIMEMCIMTLRFALMLALRMIMLMMMMMTMMILMMLMMLILLVLMLIHLWHDFGVSTVERKGKECMDENADKLDHLKSRQIPEILNLRNLAQTAGHRKWENLFSYSRGWGSDTKHCYALFLCYLGCEI